MSKPIQPGSSHHFDTAHRGRVATTEEPHDPYRVTAKPPEPSHCPDCHAVFEEGRWQWKEPLAATAPAVLCSACRRIRENNPAGFLHLEGEYLKEHRDEVLNLLHRRGDQEKAEHPVQRVMAIEPEGEGLLLTTTSVRLARSLGQALSHAHGGTLSLSASTGQDLVRLHWRR